MFKNIIFDWSGVVKDAFADHLFVVNHIFRQFGAQEISLADLRENWVQPYMAFYNKYLPNLTFEEEQAAYLKAINDKKCPSARPYSDIVQVIKDWHHQGRKMVVVSSDLPPALLSEIINFGLNDIFLDVATDIYDKSATIGELIRKHSFDKSETIIIGDSNHEIQAGKLNGIKTAAVTWGFTSEERLRAEKPDYLIRNIIEFKALNM